MVRQATHSVNELTSAQEPIRVRVVLCGLYGHLMGCGQTQPAYHGRIHAATLSYAKRRGLLVHLPGAHPSVVHTSPFATSRVLAAEDHQDR